MFKTKSKRLSTVMLLVVALLCSVFAFTSLGFTRTASAEDGALPTPIAKYCSCNDRQKPFPRLNRVYDEF